MSNDKCTLQDDIEYLKEEVDRLNKIIRGIAAWPDPWVDLKRACLMKGVNYPSLRQTKYMWKRPRGGVPDNIVNGIKVWRPETIKEWILLGDTELEERYKKVEVEYS